MTLDELAKETGLSKNWIWRIIYDNGLPYQYRIINTPAGFRKVKVLPPETVESIRNSKRRPGAGAKGPSWHDRGHGLHSPTMTEFFKSLIIVRRKAGKPLDMTQFIAEYRKAGGLEDEQSRAT